MTLMETRLNPSFAARIEGTDITRAVDESTWAEIRSTIRAFHANAAKKEEAR